ncbi:hemolysin-III channel protein-like protein Izh2 [Cucurbitaria berberidis CBS 394.84]|uniref:Hemolysin-III channel protein-like protein Izh2 n=1 Tax=Cucurbitaria berberidis CBS 394.84 TaxID=1168544 RepID=A0A9P4L8A8_9PLEO|nr:hemolysin-III channel protein-like protein Izh2 [Cucurbitaria berberidis CBS 394.84]KAF1845089.1 hemolysin-III channel protein-like protein Izh2 [Cucurbitaria berberidis CBS 394.84]
MDCKIRKPVTATTHLKDAPRWMRGDPYIKTGYRRQLDSVYRCVSSLLYLHNEWVNVWSHLLPGTIHSLVLAKECYHFSKRWDEERYLDQMVVWQYIVSCILCLLFSAGYHTLTAHSQYVAGRWLKIDYLGIILNTAAGCIASTYFGLRHHPKLQLLYIASSVVLALILFGILLAPKADGAAMAFWRSILFAMFVASGFLPMIHACALDGTDVLGLFPLAHVIGMETCYLTGVIFYITRFPEKRYPETFDIWGSSHQVFHIVVVAGQMVYITGLKQMASNFGPVSAQIALEPGFGGAKYTYGGMADVCVNGAFWG